MEENKIISKSFLWMFIGLLVTFGTGMFVANSTTMLENIFSGSYIIFAIVEILLVIFLSARVLKLKPTTAKIMFILYSFVSGLTFSSIFIVYNLNSIMLVFLVTALIFGLMSLIGFTTKIDLTKIGTYFLFGLFGVILMVLVNMFIDNDTIILIASVIGVILFIGITAYDVQKLKMLDGSGLPEDNLAIYGALDLYLDFINIFLHILSLFGKSDN